MAAFVSIIKHTTASKPHPHILYTVQVTVGGSKCVIERRYSEFVALHDALGDRFSLPPKRLFATTFVPSAWVDDALIAERRTGLANYLSALLWSVEYQNHPIFQEFLKHEANAKTKPFDFEDALPSTLPRKVAYAMAGRTQYADGLTSPIAAGYYPYWSAKDAPPESLEFEKFDVIFFGFLVPNQSSTLDWVEDAETILKRLIEIIKIVGALTKIVLSIGGYEGSQWFSQACSTPTNRVTFVNSIVAIVKSYGLHGVDIDWEQSDSKGSGNDASNLLSLLQTLRSALGPSMIISAAVGHTPWLGNDGKPLDNVALFAEQLTYINIMNYGVWGPNAMPGPNAPLANTFGQSKKPEATAEAAVARWKAAGFPPSKILLGLPLYGYVSKTTQTTLESGSLLEEGEGVGAYATYSLVGAHRNPMDVDAKEMATVDGALSVWWGKPIPFNKIVTAGALVKRFDGNYGQGEGFTLGWDDSSSTPYLFNVNTKTLITFDNTRSLAAKVMFAKENGLAGCSTWSIDQDDGSTMQDVIRSVLGK
ncbi:glycoside hydrolase [Crassisporium funariophilum]|nr:glycoside hydrolase [Crassisporium funariophilum]